MSGAMRRELTNAQVLPPPGVGQIRLEPRAGAQPGGAEAPPGCDHHDMTVASGRRGACTLVVLALGAAGCGSDGNDGERAHASPRPKASATPAQGGSTMPATKSDEAVIRGWADALRAGHVAQASRYFAIPAVVSNGTPPVRLRTRNDVVFFNTALPCGARVTKTEDRGKYVVATFRLTERSGAKPANCGSGVGGTAQTAFEIRNGKIVQWRRVIEGAPDEAPGESV
jgi:hypothetical protein